VGIHHLGSQQIFPGECKNCWAAKEKQKPFSWGEFECDEVQAKESLERRSNCSAGVFW